MTDAFRYRFDAALSTAGPEVEGLFSRSSESFQCDTPLISTTPLFLTCKLPTHLASVVATDIDLSSENNFARLKGILDGEQLEKNQIPVYFAAVIVAAFGGLLAPDASQALRAMVTPVIAVLMYAMFLQIPFLDLRNGLANKRFMAALLTANFVAIPLLVWALTMGITDHPAILVGVVLVLLTPCIDYVVEFTHIGEGDSKHTLAATPLLLLMQLVLLPVIPVYIGFMLSALLVGALVARAFKLLPSTARSSSFSGSTRNSLVVLPLALALPEEIRGLTAAAVITQTLIELISELIYIRAIPALVWRNI